MGRFDYTTLQEVFKGDGEGLAFVDFLLAPWLANNYNGIAPNYSKSDLKPDKQYSILPTVLKMIGDCRGKTVLDIGCGSGFFTFPIAKLGARMVWGIDNSTAQIKRAKEQPRRKNVEFIELDMFLGNLGKPNIIVAPFVINYARKKTILEFFIGKMHKSLKENGRIILVVDLPNEADLKRFGAVKKLLGPKANETEIQIDLFKAGEPICTLKSTYYTRRTLVATLKKIGFKNINWHKPFVSEEGIGKMGPHFWKGYIGNPELGYLSASK